MTFGNALLVATWVTALVAAIGGGALVLFWSTAAIERWLNEVERGDARLIETAVAEAATEPAPLGTANAA
ncbi:MAG TPA: hypothetical protein VL769_14775 [Acidimicrobiia bacterium]|nr:hypothetical protein [Acidimicrobiia bacterium]